MGNPPFCVLALYKHFRIFRTNDATSKNATQTETKTTRLRNYRNFIKKETQLRSSRRTNRRKPGY